MDPHMANAVKQVNSMHCGCATHVEEQAFSIFTYMPLHIGNACGARLAQPATTELGRYYAACTSSHTISLA